MHTGELSERIGVSRETVRLWTVEYSEFLSQAARGSVRNAKRVYDEKDALVLASVADARARGLEPPEIKAALRAGKLVGAVPSIASEDEKEARKSVALVPAAEYQRLSDLIRVKEDEINRIRDERDAALLAADEANRRIAELEREIGMAKGQLTERLPTATVLQIIIVVVIAALVIVAAAVIILARR